VQIDQIKNIVDYGIIGLLIFMSILTFAFAIERLLYYRAIKLSDYKHKLALEIDLTGIDNPESTIEDLMGDCIHRYQCPLYWITRYRACDHLDLLHHW